MILYKFKFKETIEYIFSLRYKKIFFNRPLKITIKINLKIEKKERVKKTCK